MEIKLLVCCGKVVLYLAVTHLAKRIQRRVVITVMSECKFDYLPYFNQQQSHLSSQSSITPYIYHTCILSSVYMSHPVHQQILFHLTSIFTQNSTMAHHFHCYHHGPSHHHIPLDYCSGLQLVSLLLLQCLYPFTLLPIKHQRAPVKFNSSYSPPVLNAF